MVVRSFSNSRSVELRRKGSREAAVLRKTGSGIRGSVMRATLSGCVLLALCGGTAAAQTMAGLDTTTFVVLGEGLAAGMANFGLSSVVQNYSFPAQMAAQMNTAFPQPLIQPPGIGDVVGYPGQDVRYPTYPQGAVRVFYQPDPAKPPAPPLFVLNLSVPGMTVADSLVTLPKSPVIQSDMKQTVINLILGFPQLFFYNQVPLWTQSQYAQAMNPTMALIELGYYEALSAAVDGNPSEMPDATTFGSMYGQIVAGLRGLQAQVICTTIPNPIDTAYFNSITASAAITATVPFVLEAGYQLGPQDYVTRNGLQAIATQFGNGALSALPGGSTMSAATAAAITANVNALNAQIQSVAKANGAVVYDLNAFLHNVKVSGVTIQTVVPSGTTAPGTIGTGNQTLTGNYLGGFYSLDGVYPGPTGHALIANDILAFLNKTYQKSFAPISIPTVSVNDPTVSMQIPNGSMHTAESLGLSGSESRRRP